MVTTKIDAYRSLYERAVSAGDITFEQFIPHPDFLVCEDLPPIEETEGGIKIPDKAQELRDLAVVLMDPGERKRPIDVRVGDVVWYRIHNSVPIVIEGRKVMLLQFCGHEDDEILGLFRINT